MPRPGRPIIVTDPNGVKSKYPSVKEASEELGMYRQTIMKYLRLGAICQAGYTFEYAPVIRRTASSGVPITVQYPGNNRIITYVSISEAARKTGINRQEIHRYLSGEYEKCRSGLKFRILQQAYV